MFEGIVNVLKPPGMTSSDVVSDIRHIFGLKRVGHLGTLDPGAAGVLPVCVGKATRLFDYLVDKEKEYIGEIRFGIATDTLDSYGTVVQRDAQCHVSKEQFESALARFAGEIDQAAPLYSALKQDGKKLYQLAREGAKVQRKTRRVTVYELEALSPTGESRFLFRLRCSKGTYVRSLCEDIGAVLNVPAHLSFLLRTASGAFALSGAHSIAALRQMKENGTLGEAVISNEAALSQFQEARVNARHKKHLLNGLAVPVEGTVPCQNVPLRVYCGEFLGVGEARDGMLKMKLML